MSAGALILVIALIVFLAILQIAWLAWILALLLGAYFLSFYLRGILSFIGGAKKGIREDLQREGKEMEDATPKPPEGAKFIKEALERTGKGIGFAERARMDGKKIPDKRDDFEKMGDASDNFITGILKLFRR